MSDTYTFDATASIVLCPACGEQIPPPRHIDVGEVPFAEAAHAASLAIAQAQEERIIEHYQRRHRFRYWLFMRTAWKRVLG